MRRTPERAAFGALLRAKRATGGLSQERLAERAELGVRTIRYLERGEVVPYKSTVDRLIDALGLTGSEREQFGAAVEQARRRTPEVEPVHTVPAQLPADVAGFTGREHELHQLDELLRSRRTRGGVEHSDARALVISAVSGTAGVGKTALATRWAHRVARDFPDGQIFVNLRGYDPAAPVDSGDALARFLSALGVTESDVPLGLDDRAARFRTETAGLRLLVVLDNAESAEQVRPLLPGNSSCLVLVTSRDSLAGLVARDGAARVMLDLLSLREATALLQRLIGARADADPDGVVRLAQLCARLPLALRVAAELAARRPDASLAELVAELADRDRVLDRLDAEGDPRAAVSAVFSWSIRNLPATAVRAFALLGLHPGPDFDGYALAALTSSTLAHADDDLNALRGAQLVHAAGPGRYGMHDLLQAYASDLSRGERDAGGGTVEDAQQALDRLHTYYLCAAAAAMDHLYPGEARRRPRVRQASTPTPPMTELAPARAWLDRELPVLEAIAASRTDKGVRDHAVLLSRVLFRYLDSGHYLAAESIHRHAERAAEDIGDVPSRAHALSSLGMVYWHLGQHDLADQVLGRALDLAGVAGDVPGQARASANLGINEGRIGRFAAAEAHLKRAVTLFRTCSDLAGEARALANLGTAEERQGRTTEAITHMRRALRLHQQLGNSDGQAHALAALGDTFRTAGDHRRAVDHHQRALALWQDIGAQSGQAWTLDTVGTDYTLLGQPDEAIDYHQRALTIFREIGEQNGQAEALNGLGEAAQCLGQNAGALAHHAAALTTSTRSGIGDQIARAYTGLGRAYEATREYADARRHYGMALATQAEFGLAGAEEIQSRILGLPISRRP